MAAWSDASAGDLRPSDATGAGTDLGAWAARVTRAAAGARAPGRPSEVHWVDQVHGATVVTVPGPARMDGVEPPVPVTVAHGPGDALVTSAPSVALAVLTADCASVALASPEGVFAAVHAGWRGLVEGVLGATVQVMADLGATDLVGAVGPCIHAECYEFSASELATVCEVVGGRAEGRTSAGRPALDLPAAVSATLGAGGVVETTGVDACTACGGGYFSHRARRDIGRQALLVWSSTGGA